MPLPLVVVNIVLFAGLGWYALVSASSASWPGVRLLWRLAALPAFALVVGGLQRLAVQAARVGWIPENTLDFLLVEWQIGQSLIVAVIGVAMIIGMRRVAGRFSDVESVAGAMMDRVSGVEIESLNLTPREVDVLQVLGDSALVDNKTLAEKLGVSADTVHSHVGSLLRKSKLSDRRDLAVVAYLHRQRQERGSAG